MGVVVLCTSESGNAHLGPDQDKIEMKKLPHGLFGASGIGSLGLGPPAPLSKTALLMACQNQVSLTYLTGRNRPPKKVGANKHFQTS